MRLLYRWPLLALLLGLLVVVLPTLAQSPTPTPTQPPAVLVIEPTPQPSPTPQGNLWQQVWEANKQTILLSAITALLVGIGIGVFLKQAAEALTRWTGQLFHLLFDRFASAPLLRLRYERDYRQTLADAVQDLASSSLVEPRKVRLEQVYVPVCLTQEMLRDRASTVEDLIQWGEDRRRRQREKAIDPWEAVRRFHRLVVLGEPGAGKTTYLAHLTFLCARRQRLPTHIPVFLRLRDLVDAERLEEALPQKLARRNFPHAENFVRRRLAEGRCLILLDGLDEVDNQEQHQHVVRLVQDFADRHAHREGNIVVVSSRTYSYAHGQQLRGFTTTLVMEFDDPAIERFVHNWFGPQEALRPLAGGLLDLLGHNRRFKELARNPLLLLLIAHHYERERNLPDLRAELYQHCIRTRITTWNERRGTHHGRFGETAKWQMLRELALDLYRRERPDLLDKESILEWLGTFMAGRRFPPDSTPEALLDEVVRTSGLIQEWALGHYGFSHRTLQEYFAAEGVKELGPAEGAAFLGKRLPALLQERRAEARWQEVVLLYCGLTPNADPLLQRILQLAGGNGPAAWLLAGRCLAEGAQRVDRKVRRRVADGLVDLLRRAESDEGVTLTPEESSQALAVLEEFAVDLPGYVRTLLDSGAPHDALLAARLLPKEADPDLRTKVSRRVVALVRAGEVSERRVAAAALGWIPKAGPETVEALRVGLTDPDPTARAEAARALGRQGADDEATVAALLRLYPDDPHDAPRHAALEALLALGRAADLGLVLVPAGQFLMGSPDDEAEADSDEKPQHPVHLPAFYLDRTPVTNAQFEGFIQAGGYEKQEYWAEAKKAGRWKKGVYVDYGGKSRTQPYFWDDSMWNQPDQPVVGVAWYEALAYARWAGKTLPSEAQWEKAASWREGERERGRKLRYPWGDEWIEGRANTEEAGIGKTTKVGRYSPAGDSPCGAADMAGNVWEWCSTRWGHAYPYKPDDGREDLGGGDDVARVLRGGSWCDDKTWARCARRVRHIPGYRFSVRGFRCCCATSSP